MATPPAFNRLSLAPLGAGDLIDRAVRLYRQHFMTLIRIAAPPVIITTLGSLMMTVAAHSTRNEAGTTLLLLLGGLVWCAGMLGNFIVMGGAARNLITHLLWAEPFSARTTYRNVRARFWPLLGASLIIALWIVVAMFMTLLVWAIGIQIVFAVVRGLFDISSWVGSVAGVIGMLVATFWAMVGFFFLFKFIAYVPQALMVEGRGAFDAIGRSFNLARGNLRRLMAMFLFHLFATYSALMILIIPLFWYGSLQGVDIMPTKSQTWPMWFAVSYSVLTQASTILLSPVWMLGLSLMYVDERVRQEGYDVELIATRHMTMPNYYPQQQQPYYPQFAPAYQQQQPAAYSPRQDFPPGSTLGLR